MDKNYIYDQPSSTASSSSRETQSLIDATALSLEQNLTITTNSDSNSPALIGPSTSLGPYSRALIGAVTSLGHSGASSLQGHSSQPLIALSSSQRRNTQPLIGPSTLIGPYARAIISALSSLEHSSPALIGPSSSQGNSSPAVIGPSSSQGHSSPAVIGPSSSQGHSSPAVIGPSSSQGHSSPAVIGPSSSQGHSSPAVIGPSSSQEHSSPAVIGPSSSQEHSSPAVIGPTSSQGNSSPALIDASSSQGNASSQNSSLPVKKWYYVQTPRGSYIVQKHPTRPTLVVLSNSGGSKETLRNIQQNTRYFPVCLTNAHEYSDLPDILTVKRLRRSASHNDLCATVACENSRLPISGSSSFQRTVGTYRSPPIMSVTIQPNIALSTSGQPTESNVQSLEQSIMAINSVANVADLRDRAMIESSVIQRQINSWSNSFGSSNSRGVMSVTSIQQDTSPSDIKTIYSQGSSQSDVFSTMDGSSSSQSDVSLTLDGSSNSGVSSGETSISRRPRSKKDLLNITFPITKSGSKWGKSSSMLKRSCSLASTVNSKSPRKESILSRPIVPCLAESSSRAQVGISSTYLPRSLELANFVGGVGATSSNIRCNACHGEFKEYMQLALHLVQAHGVRLYCFSCDICRKVFSAFSKTDEDNHMKEHQAKGHQPSPISLLLDLEGLRQGVLPDYLRNAPVSCIDISNLTKRLSDQVKQRMNSEMKERAARKSVTPISSPIPKPRVFRTQGLSVNCINRNLPLEARHRALTAKMHSVVRQGDELFMYCKWCDVNIKCTRELNLHTHSKMNYLISKPFQCKHGNCTSDMSNKYLALGHLRVHQVYLRFEELSAPDVSPQYLIGAATPLMITSVKNDQGQTSILSDLPPSLESSNLPVESSDPENPLLKADLTSTPTSELPHPVNEPIAAGTDEPQVEFIGEVVEVPLEEMDLDAGQAEEIITGMIGLDDFEPNVTTDENLEDEA